MMPKHRSTHAALTMSPGLNKLMSQVVGGHHVLHVSLARHSGEAARNVALP